MLFIAIGGLERVWSRIFGMVVGAVSKPLMVNSFLGALFMMKNNRDKKPGQQGVVGDDSSDPEAENYHGHRPASGHRYVSEHNEATVYNACKKTLRTIKLVLSQSTTSSPTLSRTEPDSMLRSTLNSYSISGCLSTATVSASRDLARKRERPWPLTKTISLSTRDRSSIRMEYKSTTAPWIWSNS